jgi:hypothetical protein
MLVLEQVTGYRPASSSIAEVVAGSDQEL